ncbi:MAG: hypothetical protein IPL26_21195 [Leptospiraceae bacterium]|nr:hypothetical protein [Leptospiraceae bacterium]
MKLLLLLLFMLTYNCSTLQEIVSKIDLEELKKNGNIPKKRPANNPTIPKTEPKESESNPVVTPKQNETTTPVPSTPEVNPHFPPNLSVDKIQIYSDGSPIIKKSYIGYMNNMEDTVTPELTAFISYSEEYRPSGFDLELLTLKVKEESYPAYKVKVYFANNAKNGIENFGSNGSLKFFYKLNKVADHNAYYYENGSLKFVKTYKSSEIKNGRIDLHSFFNLYENGKVGISVNKPIFAIIPSSQSSVIEALNEANEQEMEISAKPKELDIKFISTNDSPYDATIEDQFGPSSHSSMYGTKPAIVSVKNSDGTLCIGWNDKEKGILHLTELNNDLTTKKDISIKMKFSLFGGFIKDDSGNYYVVFAKQNTDGDFSSNVYLVKYNSSGIESGKFQLAIDRNNYDTMSPISAATSRVAYGNGKVAVHMGKTQHKNKGDGLNHQSGILFVVDTNNMQIVKDLSATWVASHSFDQRTIFDGTDFVDMDLGDNFPRGFNLHKPSGSKVIFTYKTAHYKGENRSNDNNTYSELGGLAVSDVGYVVLGSSEKSFDNNKTGTYLNESRNLFMLLVDKNFPSKKNITVEGKQSSAMVSPEVVISDGDTSNQIFYYDYGGGKNFQKRTGVVWLTNYSDLKKENVARPKLVKINDDKFVAIWEKWTDKTYVNTCYLVFNKKGKILVSPKDLGNFRLNRGDDAIEWDGKAVWVTGQKEYKKLKIHILTP